MINSELITWYAPEKKKYKPNPERHRVNCRRAMAKKRLIARANGDCERCFKDKVVEGQYRCARCIEDQKYKPKSSH